MRVRINKVKNIEDNEVSIVDQVNELYLSKTTSENRTSIFPSQKCSSISNFSSQVNLLVSAFSGRLSQNMDTCIKANDSNFSKSKVELNLNSKYSSSNLDFEGTSSAKDSHKTTDSKQTSVAGVSNFLPTMTLTKDTRGEVWERNVAINQKIEKNPRLIKTEDYNIFRSAQRLQNLSAATMTLSVPAYFGMIFSKGLNNNTKTKLMKAGLLFMFGTIGVLNHSNYKYYRFLEHLDEKYFYATSLKQLNNSKVVSTNVPKKIEFESSSWRLKAKIFRSKPQEKQSDKDYLYIDFKTTHLAKV